MAFIGGSEWIQWNQNYFGGGEARIQNLYVLMHCAQLGHRIGRRKQTQKRRAERSKGSRLTRIPSSACKEAAFAGLRVNAEVCASGTQQRVLQVELQ